MARWRILGSALGSLVIFLPALAPAGALAQSEPVFHMPFPCGETWAASTRAEQVPSVDAVDFTLPGGAPDGGRPVLAGADGGIVSAVGTPGADNGGLGEFVDVAYGTVELRFAHLQAPTRLQVGDAVDAQTIIGLVGSAGESSGAGLHYEQRVGGIARPVVIEGQPWGIDTDIADDQGDLERHPGIAHLSANCSPAVTAPAAQWLAPVAGTAVSPALHLAAWPTPTLGADGLIGDSAISGVDFQATWAGERAALCSAAAAGSDGLWTCVADLSGMDIPAGALELTFDVRRSDGTTLTAPDGVVVVTYEAGEPEVRWANGTARDGGHIPYGEPVRLVARISDRVGVEEVRFTAWYPGWANPKDAAKLPDFDANRTPRTLAVCRRRGPDSQPPKACFWEGDRRNATVTLVWDPTEAESRRLLRGVPKAVAATAARQKRCVPVTLGLEVRDVTGATDTARVGRLARHCDAKAEGLGRTVYLDPLEPPAAPGNVRVEYDATRSSRCGPDSDRCDIEVLWRDRSDDERSFSVFVGPITRASFEPCPDAPDSDCAEITEYSCGSMRRAARVPADQTSATLELRRSDHQSGRARYDGLYCVVVVASNEAGDSTRTRTPHAMTLEWQY